jgi:dGTPase
LNRTEEEKEENRHPSHPVFRPLSLPDFQIANVSGFEGNAQSLRIVTETAWVTTGIVPTKASVDSILKYKKTWSTIEKPAEHRKKFLYDDQQSLLDKLQVESSQSIECQIMDLADDIGNALIDFSDGARAGIITADRVKRWLDSQPANVHSFAAEDVIGAFNDRIITDRFFPARVQYCVNSLTLSPPNADGQRGDYKIALSPQCDNYIRSLNEMKKTLLFDDPRIQASDNYGIFIVRTLFEIFQSHYVSKNSDLLFKNKIVPPDWHRRLLTSDWRQKYRLICDYISGMTDDFAKMKFDQALEVAL